MNRVINAKTQWKTVIRDSENSDNIENGYEQGAQKIKDGVSVKLILTI